MGITFDHHWKNTIADCKRSSTMHIYYCICLKGPYTDKLLAQREWHQWPHKCAWLMFMISSHYLSCCHVCLVMWQFLCIFARHFCCAFKTSIIRVNLTEKVQNDPKSEHNTRVNQLRIKTKRKRQRDLWQLWFRCMLWRPSTGKCSVSPTSCSRTISYVSWQYDSTLQQSLVTVHSVRLQPHSSTELERINNCDPKVQKRTTLLKLKYCASFAAAPFNYISEGLRSVWLCSAPHHSPPFFHATFYPVPLHFLSPQYENN